MKHLSLFTGIGGFDLGLERAGIQTVGQVEWDKDCQTVLKRHWPNTPRWEDIQDVRGTDLPAYDVLTGGFPCQDISVAGKRAGLAGNRSGLWYEFARIIAETSPAWVVIENVPGLLSSNRGRDMGAILGFLGDNGYGFAWRVLDAQWFGVAQRRRRVFIVGHLGGNGASQILAVGQGSAGVDTALLPTRQEHPRTPPFGADGYCGECGGHENHLNMCWQPSFWEIVPEGWRSQGADIKAKWLGEGPAPTLSANASHRPGGDRGAFVENHPVVRRLTPVECARLQGFPDDWNDHLSDTQRYKQYGNAVCVKVTEWLAHQLWLEGESALGMVRALGKKEEGE